MSNDVVIYFFPCCKTGTLTFLKIERQHSIILYAISIQILPECQLQRTDVFDFSDYRRYPQEQAVKWRENAKEKAKEQNLVKARTAVMTGYVKTFAELYPDKEPDEIKLTVKVIE